MKLPTINLSEAISTTFGTHDIMCMLLNPVLDSLHMLIECYEVPIGFVIDEEYPLNPPSKNVVKFVIHSPAELIDFWGNIQLNIIMAKRELAKPSGIKYIRPLLSSGSDTKGVYNNG